MTYSFQTFTINQVLTAAQMNQVEVNIRDHVHGSAGVSAFDVVTTVQKTALFTVTASDKNKAFLCSGTFTVSFDALSTFDDNFYIWIINIGTGAITIDPNGAEVIRIPGGVAAGDATMTLPYSGSTEGPYNCSGVCLGKDVTDLKWVVLHTRETHGVQRFTAGGTWTAPHGVTTAWITGVGGGGGGGASVDTNGAGGSSGVGTIREKVAVVPGTAYTVTVGTAGAAGVGGAGGTGGTTSVGALVSLAGGNGGGVGSGSIGLGGASAGAFSSPGSASPGAVSGYGNGGSGINGGAGRGVSTSAGESAPANSGGGGGGSMNNGSNGGAGGTGLVIIEW